MHGIDLREFNLSEQVNRMAADISQSKGRPNGRQPSVWNRIQTLQWKNKKVIAIEMHKDKN